MRITGKFKLRLATLTDWLVCKVMADEENVSTRDQDNYPSNAA